MPSKSQDRKVSETDQALQALDLARRNAGANTDTTMGHELEMQELTDNRPQTQPMGDQANQTRNQAIANAKSWLCHRIAPGSNLSGLPLMAYYDEYRVWARSNAYETIDQKEFYEVAESLIKSLVPEPTFDEICANQLPAIQLALSKAYDGFRMSVSIEQTAEKLVHAAKKKLAAAHAKVIKEAGAAGIGTNDKMRAAILEERCPEETAALEAAEDNLREQANTRKLAEIDVEYARALLRTIEAQIGINSRLVR